MPDITVIVPTFRRPLELKRAVLSVLAQTNAPSFEILIVDNDPDASAENVSRELIATASANTKIRYVHEPNAGVANARNTAIAHTRTLLAAFLDDDQSVPANWLAELASFHAQYPAPVTFGPVITKLPDSTKHHRTYLEEFFARAPNLQSGHIDHYYGCGNSLLDLSLIERAPPLFDIAMNETGGEDDILFRSLQESGHTFAWCAEAPAFEHVPASRATLNYTLKRAFSYGQGPITLARTSSPPRHGMVAAWMLIGSAKALINSAFYAASWLIRSPARAVYLDRAIRGAGKVLWWVDLRFYGASALAKSDIK